MGRRTELRQRTLDQEGGLTEYLAFRLSDAEYAIPVSLVREIVRTAPITEVPRAPDDVLGIASFRGRVVTIIDLGRRLGLSCAVLPSTPGGRERTRVLMIDVGSETIGLLVDEVLLVHRLAASDIERASLAMGSDVDQHVAGIARPQADGKVLLLLDAKALVQ